jgi:hypothetical protein
MPGVNAIPDGFVLGAEKGNISLLRGKIGNAMLRIIVILGEVISAPLARTFVIMESDLGRREFGNRQKLCLPD